MKLAQGNIWNNIIFFNRIKIWVTELRTGVQFLLLLLQDIPWRQATGQSGTETVLLVLLLESKSSHRHIQEAEDSLFSFATRISPPPMHSFNKYYRAGTRYQALVLAVEYNSKAKYSSFVQLTVCLSVKFKYGRGRVSDTGVQAPVFLLLLHGVAGALGKGAGRPGRLTCHSVFPVSHHRQFYCSSKSLFCLIIYKHMVSEPIPILC